MHIKNLKIEQLYGYIDKEIDFYTDLTLLVGINGSGKTSILNILNWLISPSLPDLCVTEFNKISLKFTFKRTEYTIVCEHLKKKFKYEIKSKNKVYPSLNIEISNNPAEIGNDDQLKANLIQSYQRLAPEGNEKKTWELISKFPNPTIIGLDRNLYTEESFNQIYFEEYPRSRLLSKRGRVTSSPLDRVKQIINEEYRIRKNTILNLTNDLKNQLILSTFDGSITKASLLKDNQSKLNLKSIEKVEKRVHDYFEKYEVKTIATNEQDTVAKYFSQLKTIINQFQDNPKDDIVSFLYRINANQFNKVKKLQIEFEKFEKDSFNEMNQIENYISTLNHFLKDSAKEILFKEDTSELTFNALDKNGNILKEFKDINFLSSGEQQILILFSYIAFNSGDGKVFIIDEPELSLHIKWQEDFLDKLDKITPENTQIILATHSPILAHKKKEKAKLLLPY